jgi:predicted dithiol-disulfide oxidoreductase (DUF899 family)
MIKNTDTRSASPSSAVVDRPAWLEERLKLLEQEKELTRLRDRVAAARRSLPRVKVEINYVFDGPRGPVSLADLFDDRSQLIVHHFMLAPDWPEGCVGCSFTADHIEPTAIHLNHHDVSLVRVSRAPLEQIERFRQRMGWQVPWVSSHRNTFNRDYHVSFTPEEMAQGRAYYNYRYGTPYNGECGGLSVFERTDHGEILHTYSTYARGDEMIDSTYMLLDLTPKGRREFPNGNLTDWVRHHDRYEAAGRVAANGRAVAGTAAG